MTAVTDTFTGAADNVPGSLLIVEWRIVLEHRVVELKQRTKAFALRIIRLIRALPPGAESRVIGNQLLRSGTSVAANDRAVCRARSRADFLSKLGLVLEEADESAFWLELMSDAQLIPETRLKDLRSEANQYIAIFNASRTTAKRSFHSTFNNQKSKMRSEMHHD